MATQTTITDVLPSDWYSNPAVFALEQDRIFEHSWQLVGSAAQVAAPGDYLTFRAGTIPAVVTRDKGGDLHGLVNVCRHRGTEIVDGEGSVKSLQCRYHGWTYGLDGCLIAAPRAREHPSFSVNDHRLPRIQASEWFSMVFVNADPEAPALEEMLYELSEMLADTSISFHAMGKPIRRVWEIAANWKILVENFLECYHCPLVHPSFSKLIEMDDFEWRQYEHFATLGGSIRDGSGATGSDLFTAYIWPNTFLNAYPGPSNVANQVIVPLSPDRSLLVYDYFLLGDVEEAQRRDFLEFWDTVQREDIPLCESVHRGLASGTLPLINPMLPREELLGFLHRRVRRTVGDGSGVA